MEMRICIPLLYPCRWLQLDKSGPKETFNVCSDAASRHSRNCYFHPEPNGRGLGLATEQILFF